jgi:two-component system sensor histidine kinase AtoS
MNQLLDNALGNVEATAKTKEDVTIHFMKDYAKNLPPIEVDSAQMQQVFLNILFNAIDAIKAEGTITISTRMAQEDRLWLKISDTGNGMADASLEKIFTPFYTTKTKGTGLGLSICKSLIEQHGGRIEVESQLGCGTSFIITLPLSQANRE